MSRCVIVGGADINNYGFIREKLCANDYVIFCDSGLKHLENLQVQPSLIVGDFDSHENPHLAVETIVLPFLRPILQIYYIFEFRYDFYYIKNSPEGGKFRLFRDCFLFVCRFCQNLFSRQTNIFHLFMVLCQWLY